MRFLDDMERAADARAANANNAPADANAGNNDNANANANANAADPPNAEERVVALDMRRAGSVVGGALLVPLIASAMGGLLRRLAQRFALLRRFLAVRPPRTGLLPPPPLRRYSPRELWRRMNAETDAGRVVGLVLRAVWGDIRKLDECDPVWCVYRFSSTLSTSNAILTRLSDVGGGTPSGWAYSSWCVLFPPSLVPSLAVTPFAHPHACLRRKTSSSCSTSGCPSASSRRGA
jgi:hypothetical protein